MLNYVMNESPLRWFLVQSWSSSSLPLDASENHSALVNHNVLSEVIQPELSSLTSDDMAFVTESAATRRSLRKLCMLLVVLAPVPNACLTSPPTPESGSPGVEGAELPRGRDALCGEPGFRERGLLFGVDWGELWL